MLDIASFHHPTDPQSYALICFDEESRIIEMMEASGFYETACDDHALYVEVYGEESNLVTIDTVTGRIVLANFLNMRQAAPYQPHIDPNAGMLATLCIAESSFAGELVDVKLGGKEIVFAHHNRDGKPSQGQSRREVLTKRKNDRYYKKGGDIGKTPFVMLGVAESFSPSEL